MDTIKALLRQLLFFILGLVLSQVAAFIWAKAFNTQFGLEGLVLFTIIFMTVWYQIFSRLFGRSKSAARAAQRRRAGTSAASDKPGGSSTPGKSGS